MVRRVHKGFEGVIDQILADDLKSPAKQRHTALGIFGRLLRRTRLLFDTLNARFLDGCTKRGKAVLRGHTIPITERIKADVTVFMALP